MNSLTIDIPNKVKITQCGLVFHEALTIEEWENFGERLGKAARTSMFLIGDWLVHGEDRYSQSDAYRERFIQAMQRTGLELKTLQNAATVARSIEVSRRRENLNFSHHNEVAKLTPEEQNQWLDNTETEGLSVRRLRKSIRLGRLATDEDMTSKPTERAIDNPHPHINRLVAWWGKMKRAGWLDKADTDKRQTLKEDLQPILDIYQEL